MLPRPARTRRAVAGLLAGLLAAGPAGCGRTLGGAEGFVAGAGVVTLLEPAQRAAAPEVSGQTLDGERVALSDFAGSVVVLNVWGSWCGPCRSEAPELVAAAGRLAGDGVQFLGVNVRDDGQRARALAFVRRYGVPYPSLYDPDGSTLLGIEPRPAAIPSTVVIDRAGRVAALVLGEVDESTLVALVRDVDRAGSDAADLAGSPPGGRSS
ncbi:MAG: TlpA family protein disulfide reductase [Actinomycetota bacterium]|nr:TlpA family protein disulfide reductase [Actinomycetota bacterium]